MNEAQGELHIDSERKNLYAGPRATAVKVLNRVGRSDSYLEKVLDSELRSADLIDADKGLLNELGHGVLRWESRLDWVLNGFSHGNFAKSDINIKNALRVALYQILFLNRIPHAAAVNEAVEFVKRIRGEKPAGLVNAVLRNIIRNIDGIRYPDPAEDQIQYLAVYYAHPAWLVRRWVERFGADEATKLLTANNERPPLTLRINRLRIQPADFLRRLDELGISYQGSQYLGHFVRVRGLAKIGQMDLFRNGSFTIQDESAALACSLLDAKPGERIIDLCAAPGGKSTNIAEQMEDRGEVIAVDRYEGKLAQIKGAADRLGLKSIRPVQGDGTVIELEPADRVIVDAPCSGLGVLTKKPDIKWKREPTDLGPLSIAQNGLLDSASRMLRPGGILVYSTCTIEPEENEEVVNAFLRRHPEFALEDPRPYVSHDIVTAGNTVATFPHRQGMDGSFAARMVKRS
jgi:16S rRNA (cytosine967-C5)-methyltransferase